jgi:hypothetical protein
MTKFGQCCENWVLARNIEVIFLRRATLEACTATWNFGYQLSICCVTEENHGKNLIELVCHRTFQMHSEYCVQYKDTGDPECRDLRDLECRGPFRFVPAFLYRFSRTNFKK